MGIQPVIRLLPGKEDSELKPVLVISLSSNLSKLPVVDFISIRTFESRIMKTDFEPKAPVAEKLSKSDASSGPSIEIACLPFEGGV